MTALASESDLRQRPKSASEERWHRIFDGSADAILILDPKTLRIVDANETAARLFEYGRSELLRLDLAKPANPRPLDSTWTVHFGLGHAF